MFELRHTFIWFITHIYDNILSCILVMKCEHTLNFVSIYFQTNSLLMTKKASAFLLIVDTHTNPKPQHILEADGAHSVPVTSDLLGTS